MHFLILLLALVVVVAVVVVVVVVVLVAVILIVLVVNSISSSCGSSKIWTWTGKYKSGVGTRDGKYKLGAGAGGQAKDRGPGNTKTWFEINNMKLNKDKCDLLIPGHKYENVGVKMVDEKI